MAAEPLEFLGALERDVDTIVGGLADTNGATVVRALATCERAASEIASSLELLRSVEAPRQKMISERRAEAARVAQSESDRLAAEKAQRVSARRAKQTRSKKS